MFTGHRIIVLSSSISDRGDEQMFKTSSTDETLMHQYLQKDTRKPSSLKYLFTYATNYIFVVRENKVLHSYYVINRLKASTQLILRSKTAYGQTIRDKLIALLGDRALLPKTLGTLETPETSEISGTIETASILGILETPQEMIEHIFRKLMPQRGFVIREQQIKLSKAMYAGIQKKHLAICEAEVGTGKTYAYLVACLVHVRYEKQRRLNLGPLIHFNDENSSLPCAISTSSIDLQQALLTTYIPVMSEVLLEHKMIDKPLSAVLRKGKEHYFCQMRYERWMKDLQKSKKAADRKLYHQLLGLNLPEGSIDLDHYKGLKHDMVQKINVSKSCGMSCPHYNSCRYIKHMNDARSPTHDFQVCNHHYYLADTLKRVQGKLPLLPEHTVVVLDEAHQLIDAATQMLGTSLTSKSISLIGNMLRSYLKGNKRYSSAANQMIQALNLVNSRFFNRLISKVNPTLDADEAIQVSITLDHKEKQLLLKMVNQLKKIKMYCSVDISKNRNLTRLISETIDQMKVFYRDKQLISWLEQPSNVSSFIRSTQTPKSFVSSSLQSATCTETLTADLSKKNHVSLCSIPTDLERRLYSILWRNGIPKILTSGTLSDDQGLDYFKRTVGINFVEARYVHETRCKSPFDYRNQALLYVSENVPFPNKQNDRYIAALAEEILNLVKATCGHTVVLFTSYALLSKVHELIKDQIAFPVLKMEKREKHTVAAFKKSGNGVLFATGSFWEGVDCSGDILSSLIIVNLPFPIPTPILDHKRNELNDMKQFIHTIIFPEMIIKLKQGIGRLLRSETDTGIIAILDSRMRSKGAYRAQVLEALSDYHVTDSVEEVRDFFQRVKPKEYFDRDKGCRCPR